MPIHGLKWGKSPVASSHAGASAAHLAPGDPSELSVEAERARRVELFRRAVDAGAYRVDSCAIADRMLDRGVFDHFVKP